MKTVTQQFSKKAYIILWKHLKVFVNEKWLPHNCFSWDSYCLISEAVAWRCSVKKVFLEISQNSQENTCARVSFLIKRLWHRCFPVNLVSKNTFSYRTPPVAASCLIFQSGYFSDYFFAITTVLSFLYFLDSWNSNLNKILKKIC